MIISTTVDVEYEVTQSCLNDGFEVLADRLIESEWNADNTVRCARCDWSATVGELTSRQ